MSKNIKDSTAAIRVACAIVFLIFTFSYVYFFQTDVLAYAQHVWSGGKTYWNGEIGATIFTVVLFLIHLGISSMVRLPNRLYALTFFPSLIILGALTCVYPNNTGSAMLFGFGVWVALGLLLACVISFRLLSVYTPYEQQISSTSLFSEVSWMNMAIMCLMMIVTCGLGNSDRVFHQQLKLERFIEKGDYEKVACFPVSMNDVDSSMTMCRALALSHQGKLGEKLFEYPLCGGSKALLPREDKSVRFYYHSSVMIWKYLGAIPRKPVSNVMDFFRKLQRQKLAKECVDEYLLTALLLDGDLCGFASEIKKYYDFRTEEERDLVASDIEKRRKKLAKVIGEEAAADSIKEILITPSGYKVKELDKLPKHFREALVLYTHIHSQRVLTYHDNVFDADYEDFLKVDRMAYSDSREHDNKLREAYAGTYWYYYHQQNW